jgi:hypothetical protein
MVEKSFRKWKWRKLLMETKTAWVVELKMMYSSPPLRLHGGSRTALLYNFFTFGRT